MRSTPHGSSLGPLLFILALGYSSPTIYIRNIGLFSTEERPWEYKQNIL